MEECVLLWLLYRRKRKRNKHGDKRSCWSGDRVFYNKQKVSPFSWNISPTDCNGQDCSSHLRCLRVFRWHTAQRNKVWSRTFADQGICGLCAFGCLPWPCFCRCIKGQKVRHATCPHTMPPNTFCFPPHYIKGTLLPAVSVNRSWDFQEITVFHHTVWLHMYSMVECQKLAPVTQMRCPGKHKYYTTPLHYMVICQIWKVLKVHISK